ncbi:MAG: hypothetical protein ACI4HL_00855 [Ruminococcus sp.]
MDKKRSMLEKKSTSVILSVTSLVLIMCLLVVATYSWVGKSNVDNVNTNEMTLNLETGLDSKWEGSDVSNSISISGFDLREMSSANGRDFFVPDDSFNDNGSEEHAEQKRTTTDELRFRKANSADVYNGVGDKGTNKKFVQVTFSLSTEVNTDTPVYLSGLSTISGTGSQFVRVSIDSHDKGKDPVVFSNTALKGQEAETQIQAVSSIDSSGVATLGTQTPKALNAFTYTSLGDNSLFTIKSGESKKITLSIWLEGASGDFTSDIVNKQDIDVSMILTTKKDYTNNITVVDRTVSNWLKNGDSSSEQANLFVIDANNYTLDTELSQLNYYPLTLDADGKTWTATIPQGFTQIYIRRYSTTSSTTKWDYWGPLEIPGAEELNLNGTEEEKKNGISRTYNIIGNYGEGTKTESGKTYNYPSDVNNYEAGLWGDFTDSDFTEVKMFDQYSLKYNDEYGKYAYYNDSASTDNRYVPYVNMQLSYEYGGEQIATTLRYRMYPNNVNERLFNTNIFVKTDYEGMTVDNVGIVPYRLATNSSAGTPIYFGDGWQTKLSSTPYFANTGVTESSYWGNDIIYLDKNNNYDVNTNIYYATYFKDSDSNTSWGIMSKWSSAKGYYAIVVPENVQKVSFYRVKSKDKTSDSTTWTEHTNVKKRLNWSSDFTYSSTNNLFTLDSFNNMNVYLEDYYNEGKDKMHVHAWYGGSISLTGTYPGWGMSETSKTSPVGKPLFANPGIPGYAECAKFSSYSDKEHWATGDIELDGSFDSVSYHDSTLYPYSTDTPSTDTTGASTFRSKINISNSNNSSLP